MGLLSGMSPKLVDRSIDKVGIFHCRKIGHSTASAINLTDVYGKTYLSNP